MFDRPSSSTRTLSICGLFSPNLVLHAHSVLECEPGFIVDLLVPLCWTDLCPGLVAPPWMRCSVAIMSSSNHKKCIIMAYYWRIIGTGLACALAAGRAGLAVWRSRREKCLLRFPPFCRRTTESQTQAQQTCATPQIIFLRVHSPVSHTPTMIIPPEFEEKPTTVKPPLSDEGSSFPDQVRLTLTLILSNFTHLHTLRRALPHIAFFPKAHRPQSLHRTSHRTLPRRTISISRRSTVP